MKQFLLRTVAVLSLTIVYGLCLLIAVVGKAIIPVRKKRYNRVIINGTFHNPNWFYAHIAPVCQSNYGEVILVSDVPLADLPNLKNVCPPSWAMKLFTRAGAKAIWTLVQGIKYPADCHMGYHIFPAAVTSLVCARLTGAKAAYQVTSGQLELEGGGWHAENPLLVALGKPSVWIEKLALLITRCFDLVVVRGSGAKKYVLDAGFTSTLEIVTGSVVTNAELMREHRDIDVLFVGRLTEYKRPDRFLKVISAVVKQVPNCRVAIVGDGPDRAELENTVSALGLTENVEFLGQRRDVPELQGRSKIFVLTSRWEGVSIAMLEAMGLANVPIVSDVGDLRDFAIDGKTGYVCGEEELGKFSRHIIEVLKDESLYNRLSKASRELILEKADRNVVSKRWYSILDRLKSE